jgi:hypothetical protein
MMGAVKFIKIRLLLVEYNYQPSNLNLSTGYRFVYATDIKDTHGVQNFCTPQISLMGPGITYPWRTCMLYASAVDLPVAYNFCVRLGCYGSFSPHHPTTCSWRPPILYATATAVAVAYTFLVRLCYVAVACRNLCTPRKTIPPIAIFLVVGPSSR